jgi:hypothetical protein
MASHTFSPHLLCRALRVWPVVLGFPHLSMRYACAPPSTFNQSPIFTCSTAIGHLTVSCLDSCLSSLLQFSRRDHPPSPLSVKPSSPSFGHGPRPLGPPAPIPLTTSAQRDPPLSPASAIFVRTRKLKSLAVLSLISRPDPLSFPSVPSCLLLSSHTPTILLSVVLTLSYPFAIAHSTKPSPLRFYPVVLLPFVYYCLSRHFVFPPPLIMLQAPHPGYLATLFPHLYTSFPSFFTTSITPLRLTLSPHMPNFLGSKHFN